MKHQIFYCATILLMTLATTLAAVAGSGKRASGPLLGSNAVPQSQPTMSNVRLELVKQLVVCDVGQIASRVYQMNGFIFAMCKWNESEIHVFDAVTFEKVADTRWNIPGNTVIADINVNPSTNTLYVRIDNPTTGNSNYTWKVSVTNDSAVLYNTVDYTNIMKSVSAIDHVLIVEYLPYPDSKLHVYGTDGVQLENFVLPNDNARSVLEETTPGTYLMAVNYNESDPCTFKDINANGEVLQKYHPFSNFADDQLLGLSLAGMIKIRYGFYIASVMTSTKMYVLSSSLSENVEIQPDGLGTSFYNTITGDETQDRVLIIPRGNKGNFVNVYDVKYDQSQQSIQ